MATIHFFGGEKGGVGKSFVCRTAVQYHLDTAQSCVLIETDRSNPDVKRIYGDHCPTQVAIFSESEKHEDAANSIYNTALTNRVLVNLPAQAFIPLKQWFLVNDVFTIAADDGVEFYLWFILDGGYDSYKLLKQSLAHFGAQLPHIVVQNSGKCEEWDSLTADTELQALLKANHARRLTFPKFIGTSHRNQIDAASLTFAAARQHPEFGAIGRQRVKRFLSEAYAAFETTGVFTPAVQPQNI